VSQDNLKLHGVATLHKWEEGAIEKLTAIEERLRREIDDSDSNHHKNCHTPGERGGGSDRPDTCNDKCEDHSALGPNDEIHVECGYIDVQQKAIEELAKAGVTPTETLEFDNSLVNTGLTDFGNGLIGGALTVYSNANAKIGVGDTVGATAVTDTDLKAAVAAANRWIQAMDATYPVLSNGVTTWRATFATGNANFAWQEMAISNSASAGAVALTRMLNRFLNAAGTKPGTQSWQLTITLTLS